MQARKAKPGLPRFDFRPLAPADLPMLYEWMGQPHWAQWWGAAESFSAVQAEYGAWIADPSVVQPCIVLLDGVPFGYAQSYAPLYAGGGWWPEETDPGVRGIDQSIARPQDLDRGLGTAMVKALIGKIFSSPGVTRIQTDPHPANLRAIRCYEKAGFRAVREVRTPDGPALLMICERGEDHRPDR